MNLSISQINFLGKPDNYAVIDKYLSRSAQPKKEDILWLKDQGVTDIFNFRTMYAADINYDEKAEVEKAGIKYHNIPSITKKPTEENVNQFLREVEEVKSRGGKAHIHCKAGADRTGMYSFIYKIKNGLGSLSENKTEWFKHGYHFKLYPTLMDWADNFVSRFKK